MEYCPTGSISDLMKILGERTLTEAHIAAICKGVLQGLQYLHQNKKVFTYYLVKSR